MKKENKGLIFVIVLLLTITTIASSIGLWAWSRYTSSLNGEATAQVAKWYFELKNGEMELTEGEGEKTLLEFTRTDDYGNVAQGKVAPGTHGEFPIVIDTTGTEVDLQYTIVVTVENCPTNMTFASASGSTVGETRSGTGATTQDPKITTITITNSVSHSVTDANRKHNETLTWNWPYETLDGNNSALTGDAVDKEDAGKEITVTITATGTEDSNNSSNENQGGNSSQQDEGGDISAENSVYTLAQNDIIKRWDRISYNPGTDSISNSDITAPGALLSSTISASASNVEDWVVLDVDQETGDVLIIPKTYSASTLQLTGMDGYNNGKNVMNQIASIYCNSAYAKEARSINYDDIAKIAPSPWGIGKSSCNIYNIYSIDENGCLVQESSQASRQFTTTTVSGEELCYTYYSNGIPSQLGSYDCWLASRSMNLTGNTDEAYFGYRVLKDYEINREEVFYISKEDSPPYAYNIQNVKCTVLPVVILKKGMQLEKVNNVWQFVNNN